MKRLLVLTVSLSLLALAASLPAPAQDANEETQLISVLQSDHSLQEKDAACARLKWIGTAQCIPALSQLLADPQLSHSARYALESMPGPAAGNALRQALPKTSGSNEVGILDSLGARRDTAAVPAVAKLLTSSDAALAVAAAQALGKIGGPEALAALESAWSASSTGAVHNADTDALLACANRMLKTGEGERALPIFKYLYDREKDDGVRLAAYRGIILASDKRGLALMVKAIAGPDGPSQGAALQLASKLGGPATTAALGRLLPKLSVPVQIALLQCLAQRGDRSAMLFVSGMLDSSDLDVRLAVLTALGDLGNGDVVLPLARHAAAATGAEKIAARQALADLRHGPVTEALLKALDKGPPEVQSELIRALGGRADASAAPKMLELARGQNDLTRSAALQALALLAGPEQVPAMVKLVVLATNEDTRSAAADALGSACQHIQSQKGSVNAAPLADAVRSGPIEARVALLGVCSGVSDSRVREVLRAAISDPDERVRGAAIRALCDSQDEQLLPDMLTVAREMKAANFRMLGIRGCVRLVTQETATPLPLAQKMDTLKSVQKATFNAEGKRLVLSGLGSVADLQALDLAASMLEDPEVKVEAAEATVQIARAVAGQHSEEAAAALHQVLSHPANDAVRKSAQAALKKMTPKK
jgi:HEAT repeat protein